MPRSSLLVYKHKLICFPPSICAQQEAARRNEGLSQAQKDIVDDFFQRSKASGAPATTKGAYACWPEGAWKGAVVPRPHEHQIKSYVTNTLQRKLVRAATTTMMTPPPTHMVPSSRLHYCLSLGPRSNATRWPPPRQPRATRRWRPRQPFWCPRP